MAATDKVIITCAITGAIHTPTMSPYLPITPDQIAAEAIAAAEAGAAILHLHARDPETGKPDQTPEAFARFLPRIKQGTNAAINITTGGSPYMRVEERVRPAATFKPEVASLNMGSINFGLYHLLAKYKEFKFDWEKAHLEATRDLVFRNSFKDIEFILATCYDNGTRFEFECYDIAHLYNLRAFRRPQARQAAVLRSVRVRPSRRHRHASGGRRAHEAHRRPAVRRQLSLVGARRRREPIADRRTSRRHGLEYPRRPRRQPVGRSGQAREVERRAGELARKIIEGLGKEVATPDEAREILSLKGGDKVAF